MGKIIIDLTDEQEQIARKWARKRYGTGKNALNKLFIQLVEWETERMVAVQEAIDHMRHSGWSMHLKPGEKVYESRDELYD